MSYLDQIQHTLTSGGRSLRVATDHGPERSVHRLTRDVDVAYRAWLRRRGMQDEELLTKRQQQMAKARKMKALRRACR